VDLKSWHPGELIDFQEDNDGRINARKIKTNVCEKNDGKSTS